MNRRNFILSGLLYFANSCKSKSTENTSEVSSEISKREDLSDIIRRHRQTRNKKLLEFLGVYPEADYGSFEPVIKYNPGTKVYLDNINSALKRNSLESRIDPLLMLAIVGVESDFNTYAISNKSAGGPFQIMPDIGEDYGLRIHNLGLYREALVAKGKGRNREYESLLRDYIMDLRKNVQNKNQQELKRIDQRFAIDTAADASVRIIKDNLDQTRSRDRAIAAYYAGTEVANRRILPYDVRKYVRNVNRTYSNLRSRAKGF